MSKINPTKLLRWFKRSQQVYFLWYVLTTFINWNKSLVFMRTSSSRTLTSREKKKKKNAHRERFLLMTLWNSNERKIDFLFLFFDWCFICLDEKGSQKTTVIITSIVFWMSIGNHNGLIHFLFCMLFKRWKKMSFEKKTSSK
jgi:hypothetical protein